MLAERAREPELSPEERLRLARRLADGGFADVALALYDAVLREDPARVAALLGKARILSARDDARGAVPLLEKALAEAGPGDGEIPFLLGEAYYASHREEEGRRMIERALPLLRSSAPLTILRESRVAVCLARLGRGNEARAIFERLVALAPESRDLLLDYAGVLVVLGARREARRVLDQARLRGAEARRVLELDGQLKLIEGRAEEALEAYRRGRELYGPSAAFSAGIGEASASLGRLADAVEAYSKAVELSPGNRSLPWVRRRVADRIASPVTGFTTGVRTVSRDVTRTVRAEGSLLLDRDRTRCSASLFRGSFRGRAKAVEHGRKNVTADITGLSLALGRRFGAGLEVGAGLDLYRGRGHGPGTGGFLEALLRSPDPYASLALRIDRNDLFGDPPAAAGLGGKRDGVTLSGYRELGSGSGWVSGRARAEEISFVHPRRGRLSDLRLRGEVTAGVWIRNAGPEVADRLRAREVPAVITGGTVAGEPPEGEGPRISAWLSYSAVRLPGDGELAGPLPLGTRYDYVTGTLRLTGTLAPGLTGEVEGYGGTDLAASGAFGGGLAGISWRPRPGLSIRIRGEYGRAFGRTGGGATGVELALTWAW